jgi:hypothetical protein
MGEILLVTATGVSWHFQQVRTMISYGTRRKFGLVTVLVTVLVTAAALVDASSCYKSYFDLVP